MNGQMSKSNLIIAENYSGLDVKLWISKGWQYHSSKSLMEMWQIRLLCEKNIRKSSKSEESRDDEFPNDLCMEATSCLCIFPSLVFVDTQRQELVGGNEFQINLASRGNSDLQRVDNVNAALTSWQWNLRIPVFKKPARQKRSRVTSEVQPATRPYYTS